MGFNPEILEAFQVRVRERLRSLALGPDHEGAELVTQAHAFEHALGVQPEGWRRIRAL